jgi:hypothetical protein
MATWKTEVYPEISDFVLFPQMAKNGFRGSLEFCAWPGRLCGYTLLMAGKF